MKERRAHVWIDAALSRQLERFSLPGASQASMLRLLARAALVEIENIQLSEGLLQIAPLAWSAVAQRRVTPRVLERLPQLVDEALSAAGASYAMRAKVFALLLPLSPLLRLAVLIAGSQREREGV
jgi:hypothetical protein